MNLEGLRGISPEGIATKYWHEQFKERHRQFVALSSVGICRNGATAIERMPDNIFRLYTLSLNWYEEFILGLDHNKHVSWLVHELNGYKFGGLVRTEIIAAIGSGRTTVNATHDGKLVSKLGPFAATPHILSSLHSLDRVIAKMNRNR